MANVKGIFHKISYLQYVFIPVTLYYYTLFVISLTKNDINWIPLNKVLIFVGIAISLSSLQDTTTTQNKFSRKIWEHPKKGKYMLIYLSAMSFILITAGLIAYLFVHETILQDVSFGLMMLGIGILGLLKAAIEMYENHRLDKNPPKLENEIK